MRWILPLIALLCAAPLAAKDSLGIFGDWGAFRDPRIPRCYAIAQAQPERRRSSSGEPDYEPYASIGTWPRREIRGQVHFRLSRKISPIGPIRAAVGGQRFELTGGGGDAWAQDQTMDAAIVAAMRSGTELTVSARGTNGRMFTDRYSLDGVATAMDAATVGCARLK